MDITQTTPSTCVTSKRLLEFGFGFAPALIIDAAVKFYIFDVRLVDVPAVSPLILATKPAH